MTKLFLCSISLSAFFVTPLAFAAIGQVDVKQHPRNRDYIAIVIDGEAAQLLFSRLGKVHGFANDPGGRYVQTESGLTCWEESEDGALGYHCNISLTSKGELGSPPTPAGIGVTN